MAFVERLIPERGKEVFSMLYIFDVLQLCILIVTLISYSNSPLTLFWDLWRHSVCLTLLKSLQRSANDLLLLIYMAPRTSFMAAVGRNYGSCRTASPTIETETPPINRRAESEMDRLVQFDDLSD